MAWDEILGQDLARRILKAHLEAGKVSSAYLLVGPEGVGKRRIAIEMAKALNCTGGTLRPCDQCPSCAQINRQVHPDVHALAPGGASNQIGIEHVRHLLGRIALKPYSATVQVAIIDGAERLTEEAANALLKSLEEPSVHTRFFLTTSQLPQCLPTIVSRCQVIRCQPLPSGVVRRILTTQGCDPHVAETVVRLSRGSASEAISLAGRWIVYEAILERLAGEPMTAWVERPLPETRQEVVELLDGMLSWLRDLAVAATQPEASASAVPSDIGWAGRVRLTHTTHEESLRRQARTVDVDRCVAAAFELIGLRDSLEQFVSPRLVAGLAREKWLSLTEVKYV